MHTNQKPETYYSWKQLPHLLGGISRATWWRMIRRGEAPTPVRISTNRVAWPASAISTFQALRTGAC